MQPRLPSPLRFQALASIGLVDDIGALRRVAGGRGGQKEEGSSAEIPFVEMNHHRARVSDQELANVHRRVPATQDVVGWCCNSFRPLNSSVGRSDRGIDGRRRRRLGAAAADGLESEAGLKAKLSPVLE